MKQLAVPKIQGKSSERPKLLEYVGQGECSMWGALSPLFIAMGLSLVIVGCQGGTGLIGDALQDHTVVVDPVDEPATDNWQQALLSTEATMQQAATRLADSLKLEADADAAEARGDTEAAATARARAEAARQEAQALQAKAQQELAQVQAHLVAVQAETEQLQTQLNQIQNEQDPLSIRLRAKLTEKQQVSGQIQTAITRIEQVRVQIAQYTEALRLKQRPLRGYGYAHAPFREDGSPVGGLPAPLSAHGWYYNWDFSHKLMETDPRYVPMLWGGPSCARQNVKNCSQTQIQQWVDQYVGKLREDVRYRGRNWLVWNEPDDSHQSYLDAPTAAKVWNVLYANVKAVDPTTRLYCCGTHPGWEAKQNTNLNWMGDFLAAIDQDKAPDGIHYHNYSCFPDPADSTRATCGGTTLFEPSFNLEVMEKMERFVQSQPLIRGRDIVITEWAGLASDPIHQCDGVNNRRLMRGVASFLSTWGKYLPGHKAASWFISVDPDGPKGAGTWYGSQLVHHTNESALTCLGQEYEAYRFGSVPAPSAQSLYAAHQTDTTVCGARLDIAIPGKNHPESWRAHLIAYDWAGNRLGPIQNYDVAPASGVLHCGTYFPGNDQWPDTWYRVRGTKAALKARGLPRRVRVRLELPGAAPSDFAQSVDLGP